MKTYEEFRREVMAEIKRAEEMSLKPKEYSYAQIEVIAAKEYAKQWVHEFALQTFHHLDARGYNDILTQLEPRIKDLIDAQ